MIYGNISGPFYHESDEHFRAKMRIARLLDKEGWDVWFDEMKGFAMLALSRLYGTVYVPREYRFDIYAERFSTSPPTGLRKVIMEIDYKGHLTKWSKHKGDMRDEIWRNHKIITVRFPLKWIVGRKKIEDSDILKELEHSQSTLKSDVLKNTA